MVPAFDRPGGYSYTYFATSDDGGITWTMLSAPPSIEGDGLVLDPTSPGHLYSFTITGVSVSTDGGNSWHESNNGLTIGAPTRIALDPSNPGVAYATEADDLYRTDDGGGHWEELQAGVRDPLDIAHHPRITDVAVTSDGTVYALQELFQTVDPDTTVIRSSDGGATWTDASGELPRMRYTKITARQGSPNVLYLTAAGFNGGPVPSAIFTTEDGGGSWSPIGPVGWQSDALAIDQATGTMLTTVDAPPSGRTFISHDWGVTWGELPLVAATAIAFGPNPSVIYTGDGESRVSRSEDGGQTWTTVVIANSQQAGDIVAIAVDPDDPDNVFAGTQYGGLYVSRDGGDTWAQRNPGMWGIGVLSIVFPPAQSASEPLLASVSAPTGGGVWRMVPAPSSLVAPSLTGTVKPGKLLTCKPGRWARSKSFQYQWLLKTAPGKNGLTPIKNATKSTYRLPATSLKHLVGCRVTAVGPGGRTQTHTRLHRVSK